MSGAELGEGDLLARLWGNPRGAHCGGRMERSMKTIIRLTRGGTGLVGEANGCPLDVGVEVPPHPVDLRETFSRDYSNGV